MQIKLATELPPIMDQYDDGGRLFLDVLGSAEIPEIVKTATDMSRAARYPADFALAANTSSGPVFKYPLLDPGNAVVSTVYFEKTAGYLPADVRAAAAARLVSALADYGLQPSQYLTDAMSAQVKTASVDDALRETFPRKSVSLITDVEEQLAQLSPRGKREAALLLKSASMRLPAAYAVYGETAFGSDFEMAIDARARLLPARQAEALLEMKKVAGVSPDELASALYEFDVDLHLTQYYGHIPDPYQAVFGTSLKKLAMASKQHVVVNDRNYSAQQIADFANTHADDLASSFGSELARELASSPVEVLGSLPDPHRHAIARMIDAG